jgi:outer membrane receptor for ferrienterochelin and colicin
MKLTRGIALARVCRSSQLAPVRPGFIFTGAFLLTLAISYTEAPNAVAQQAPASNPAPTPLQSLPNAAADQAHDSPANSNQTGPNEAIHEVVVEGERISSALSGVIGTGDIVSHEDLIRYSDSTLADALQRIPGITVDGVPGLGGTITLRGLGGGYTQLLLNGEPVPANFSLDSLQPELVERVEIIRTPGADISNQGIGGIINIVLRKDVRRARRDLKLGVGSMGGVGSQFLDGDLSDKKERFSYSLASSASHENHPLPDQIYNTASSQTPDSSYTWLTHELGGETADTVSASPRLNWSLADNDTVTSESLIRFRHVIGSTRDTIAELTGVPPLFSNDSLRFSSTTTAARTTVDWAHPLASGTLDVNIGASVTDRKTFATFDGYDDGRETLLMRTVQGDTRDVAVSSKGKLTIKVSERNSLAYGWDGNDTRRVENRLQNDITAASLTPEDLNDSYVSTVTRFALFAKDEWQLPPHWNADSGLRWEGIDTKTSGNVIDAAHNRSGVWSPVIQASWKPSDSGKLEFDVAVSRTYKAPTTAELVPRRFFSDINTQVSPDTEGNPNLRPELAWGLDWSASRQISDDGLIAFRSFLRRIDNVILQTISDDDGRWVSYPINDGMARVTGVSLESKLNLRSVDSHAPPVSLSASLERTWSYVDALLGPNNHLAREIPFSGTFGIDYAIPILAIAFGMNFKYQGVSLTQLSDTQGAYSGVVRNLDFYGSWKLSAKGQIRLSIKNVLHQDRMKVSSFIDATDTDYAYSATPSYIVGRLTLEFSF